MLSMYPGSPQYNAGSGRGGPGGMRNGGNAAAAGGANSNSPMGLNPAAAAAAAALAAQYTRAHQVCLSTIHQLVGGE